MHRLCTILLLFASCAWSQIVVMTIGGGSGGGAGNPGGSDTQVQFNDANNFGGDAGLTYNKTTKVLTVASGIVTGADNTASGMVNLSGLTSGSAGFAVNDVAGSEILYLLPATNGAADQILYDSGAVTCPTLPAGAPSVCHQLLWLSKTGTGNFVGATSPTIVTPTIASFANAAHDHSNAAGGANISTTAVDAGNKQGNGTKFQIFAGSAPSTDHCAKFDANGNIVTAGAPCGGGGSANVPPMIYYTGNSIASGVTSYGAPGFNQAPASGPTTVQLKLPVGGTASKLRLYISTPQPGSGCTLTVRLQKNDVDTAVSVTVAPSSAAGWYDDGGAVSETYAANDLLNLAFTESACGSASATIRQTLFDFR